MAKLIAVIRNGKIVYGGEAVVAKPTETAARENRESMKTKHRKDMLQKNNLEYYRAFPKEAENLSDGLRRQL